MEFDYTRNFDEIDFRHQPELYQIGRGGMDMARKFLQMGYTRARRYANHKGGRKYSDDGEKILPFQNDKVKAESAEIFQEKWRLVREDKKYLEMKKRHRELYEKQ